MEFVDVYLISPVDGEIMWIIRGEFKFSTVSSYDEFIEHLQDTFSYVPTFTIPIVLRGDEWNAMACDMSNIDNIL